MLENLRARLNQPQGVASYGQIQQYLTQEQNLPLSSSAVPALVRYKLRAKPKAPRRSQPKKSPKRSRSFSTRLLPSF
jgi:hypothetical protein